MNSLIGQTILNQYCAVITPTVPNVLEKPLLPLVWITRLLLAIGTMIFLVGCTTGGQRPTTQENVSATLAAPMAGQQTAQAQEVEVARLTAQAIEATGTAMVKSTQDSQARATQDMQATLSAAQQQGAQATAQALAATYTALAQSLAAAETYSARQTSSAVPTAQATQTTAGDSGLVCGVPDVTGTWQGTVYYKGNTSPFAWKLEQHGCTVTGSDITGFFYYSALRGTVAYGELTLDFLYKTEDFCAPHAILDITADHLRGKITNCNGGSFDLTRTR